jgi:hypothetical protein
VVPLQVHALHRHRSARLGLFTIVHITIRIDTSAWGHNCTHSNTYMLVYHG